MKKTVFFLLLSMAFLTTNAQNLNTKDLSKVLEIPYSNIEQGLEKLDELKCKKDTDEKVQRTKLVEKYHPFVCASLGTESISFTVYKTLFVAIENLYFPKDYYHKIVDFLEKNYVFLPERNNKWEPLFKVFRSTEKFYTLSRKKDYRYITLSITEDNLVSLIANAKY